MKSSRKNDLHRGWMHAPAYWLRQQVDWRIARGVEWKSSMRCLSARGQRDGGASEKRVQRVPLRVPYVISGPQIRAARGFLAWTARDLANKAVVAIATVQKIESGELAASLAELVAIQATFAAEGIEFTNDDGVLGVRLHRKKPSPNVIGPR